MIIINIKVLINVWGIFGFMLGKYKRNNSETKKYKHTYENEINL